MLFHQNIVGQMMPQERKFLFDAVFECKPKTVLEVGTWRGGGSTLQIIQALNMFGGIGTLHICETNIEWYKESVELYKYECEYSNIIKLYNIESTKLIIGQYCEHLLHQ